MDADLKTSYDVVRAHIEAAIKMGDVVTHTHTQKRDGAGDPDRVAVVTAYSSDYKVGFMCDRKTRAYCRRQGYDFYSVVPSRYEMSR